MRAPASAIAALAGGAPLFSTLLVCTLLVALPAAAAGHRGGVLRMLASAAAGTDDPQINYEEEFNQIFAFTQDGLVTFRKVDGAAGNDVVADLAETLPVPTDGGTTYVFHLRRGIRFSTGREVTVDDVMASLRRMFKVEGPNVGSWYNIIVGADACLKSPADCTLAGGVAADPAANTVTIHLTHPSGEFLAQMALPFAAILPADTPAHDLGTTPPVATGAYRIASYDPTHEMRIVRNPYFHQWDAQAQPDGYVDSMVYRFGLQDESEVTAVENGQQDWMFDQKPLDRLTEIGGRFVHQAHITPLAGYFELAMNTHEKPFTDARVRQAVELAINRRAVVNLFGGPALGTPLCQLLPSDIPGYVPYCPYSSPPGKTWIAPDLPRARALVAASGMAGMKVTLITSDRDVERSAGIYLQSVLADIGFNAGLHSVSFNIRDTYMENSNNHVQIGLTDWFEDYPSPSDFLRVSFSCTAIHPGSDASINISEFCDPAIEHKMDQALALGATNAAAANALWTEVDHELTDAAPSATLFQVNWLDIVSPRVGNYRCSPIYHMLLALAWVQ